MLCTLWTSVSVAKSFSLENRSLSMHRKRALSPPLSRYFSCPTFFFCWAFTRKASFWWEKFLGKFFDCRIIWKEVWVAVGSGTRYSCEFLCQLDNTIQFNFIIHTCLYKIFTLYIVRQEYTNKGEEEGKKRKLMAWVEVYGGQRSLAFELTTGCLVASLSVP